MSILSWTEHLGLEDPSIDEFIYRPDMRQISSFFLGALFTTSVYYLLHSPTLASIVSIFRRRRRRRRAGGRAEPSISDAASKSTATSINSRLDPLALVFIMNLVYTTTAATQFASLFAFSTAGGSVPCIFLVAWGTLGAETVRLIGLLKLSLHLREIRPSNWERTVLWIALALLAIAMFFNTAVATGTLRQIPQIEAFALCYRRHFTLGAGVVAGMNFFIEFYVLFRLVFFILLWVKTIDGRLQVGRDVRVYRTLSLIFLDAATVYPSLFPTSLVADYIPFSVASILVLVAFNHGTRDRYSVVSSVLHIHPPSLPQSIRIPTPSFSPFLNLSSPTPSSPKDHSPAEAPQEEGPAGSASRRGSVQTRMYRHSFTAVSFVDELPAEVRGQPSSTSRFVPSGEATRLAGESKARLNLLNRRAIQRRAATYEAFLQEVDQRPLMQSEQNNVQDAPTAIESAPLNASHTSRRVLQRSQRARLSDLRGTRQILPRQREVADLMVAAPRPNRPGHQITSSLGSALLQEIPAPPRLQRIVRKVPEPIVIPPQGKAQPVTARPSSPDSTRVFGSDIILGPQEDVMRVRVTQATPDDPKGRQPRLELASRSTFSIHLPESSHQSIVTSFGDVYGPRTADSTRPTTGNSTQSRSGRDSLSIVHEAIPSSTRSSVSGDVSFSKRAINTLKRPTFGEASFDRFKSGLPTFTEIVPLSTEQNLENGIPKRSTRDEGRYASSGSSLRVPSTQKRW